MNEKEKITFKENDYFVKAFGKYTERVCNLIYGVHTYTAKEIMEANPFIDSFDNSEEFDKLIENRHHLYVYLCPFYGEIYNENKLCWNKTFGEAYDTYTDLAQDI